MEHFIADLNSTTAEYNKKYFTTPKDDVLHLRVEHILKKDLEQLATKSGMSIGLLCRVALRNLLDYHGEGKST